MFWQFAVLATLALIPAYVGYSRTGRFWDWYLFGLIAMPFALGIALITPRVWPRVSGRPSDQ